MLLVACPPRPSHTNRDQCISPGNGNCGGVVSRVPTLLASSVVLLALCVISALLLATAIKAKCLRGGVSVGGDSARPEPANATQKASYFDPEAAAPGSNGVNGSSGNPQQQQQLEQQPTLRESDEEEEDEEERPEGPGGVRADFEDERKEEVEKGGGVGGNGSGSGSSGAREVLTGAEPWAVGYVERLAGGGNKKRRDELNNLERGHGSSSGGSELSAGGGRGGGDVSQ